MSRIEEVKDPYFNLNPQGANKLKYFDMAQIKSIINVPEDCEELMFKKPI